MLNPFAVTDPTGGIHFPTGSPTEWPQGAGYHTAPSMPSPYQDPNGQRDTYGNIFFPGQPPSFPLPFGAGYHTSPATPDLTLQDQAGRDPNAQRDPYGGFYWPGPGPSFPLPEGTGYHTAPSQPPPIGGSLPPPATPPPTPPPPVTPPPQHPFPTNAGLQTWMPFRANPFLGRGAGTTSTNRY